MLDCANCLDRGYFDKYCPDCRKCPYRDILEYEHGNKANVIINRFTDFSEIVVYKDLFQVPQKVEVNREIDRSRKFITDDSGVIVATKWGEIPELEEINNTIYESGKRAKDNFYGYAFCNRWDYFLTVTVDPKQYPTEDQDIRYFWKLFRQSVQSKEKDVRILCAPERHASGIFHYHAVVGGIDFSPYISRAVHAHTGEFLYTKFGDPVYNLRLWKYGHTTLVPIGGHGNDQEKVANYLISYTTKENSDIGYNKKRYFRTHNLDFKEKDVSFYTREELATLLQDLTIVEKKDNERMTVFRLYPIPEQKNAKQQENRFEEKGKRR